MSATNALPHHTALHLLAQASSHILADFAFGDREVTWTLGDEIIANGYFGSSSHVSFTKEALAKLGFETGSFSGEEAYKLKYLGQRGTFERNDVSSRYED